MGNGCGPRGAGRQAAVAWPCQSVSPAGLTRGSIFFARTLFAKEGWIAGSSPAMTPRSSGIDSLVWGDCSLENLYMRGVRRSALAARQSGPVCRMDSRSEEHTSELQSLRHLVCRLLL